MRESAKVGKETPTLHRKVIGQRSSDDGSLFDLKATWRSRDERIGTRKRIDRGGETKLGSTEFKIVALVLPIRKRGVDNETDRRVKLRGEGLARRRECGLEVAQDLFPDFLLELFAVASSRWRRHSRHRRSCRGTELLDGVFLLPYLVLHLPHLFLHSLKVAP